MKLTAWSVLLCLAAHPVAAGSLSEAQAEAQRLIDEGRRAQGWPPASDPTAAAIECQRRIRREQLALSQCAGARAARLVRASREDAATLAVAVVAGCSMQREALIRSAWPMCVPDRAEAESAAAGFIASVERDMIAIITEYRAAPRRPERSEPRTNQRL